MYVKHECLEDQGDILETSILAFGFKKTFTFKSKLEVPLKCHVLKNQKNYIALDHGTDLIKSTSFSWNLSQSTIV